MLDMNINNYGNFNWQAGLRSEEPLNNKGINRSKPGKINTNASEKGLRGRVKTGKTTPKARRKTPENKTEANIHLAKEKEAKLKSLELLSPRSSDSSERSSITDWDSSSREGSDWSVSSRDSLASVRSSRSPSIKSPTPRKISNGHKKGNGVKLSFEDVFGSKNDPNSVVFSFKFRPSLGSKKSVDVTYRDCYQIVCKDHDRTVADLCRQNFSDMKMNFDKLQRVVSDAGLNWLNDDGKISSRTLKLVKMYNSSIRKIKHMIDNQFTDKFKSKFSGIIRAYLTEIAEEIQKPMKIFCGGNKEGKIRSNGKLAKELEKININGLLPENKFRNNGCFWLNAQGGFALGNSDDNDEIHRGEMSDGHIDGNENGMAKKKAFHGIDIHSPSPEVEEKFGSGKGLIDKVLGRTPKELKQGESEPEVVLTPEELERRWLDEVLGQTSEESESEESEPEDLTKTVVLTPEELKRRGLDEALARIPKESDRSDKPKAFHGIDIHSPSPEVEEKFGSGKGLIDKVLGRTPKELKQGESEPEVVLTPEELERRWLDEVLGQTSEESESKESEPEDLTKTVVLTPEELERRGLDKALGQISKKSESEESEQEASKPAAKARKGMPHYMMPTETWVQKNKRKDGKKK